MPGKTLLAIGAHYDDCVFGIPGILLDAVRKHYRVVILSLIGDYTTWPPAGGRQKEMLEGTARISKEFGVETRYLTYKSHQFDVNAESRRAVAAAVAAAEADIAFYLFPRDRHADHNTASTLSEIALRGAPSILDKPVKLPRFVYQYDNGPRHTIGFEPNTYVDISPVWPDAIDWLGKTMAMMRNQPYDRAKPDPSQKLKETIARYRGAAAGVPYAEALWLGGARVQEIL